MMLVSFQIVGSNPIIQDFLWGSNFEFAAGPCSITGFGKGFGHSRHIARIESDLFGEFADTPLPLWIFQHFPQDQ